MVDRSVLVCGTRPSGRDDELLELLRRAGYEAVAVPLTEIHPLPDASVALGAALDECPEATVVVTSASAAPTVAAALREPGQVAVVAIGAATATALADLGIRVTTLEGASSGAELATALLRHGMTSVIHAAAADPRPELGRALVAGGGDYLAVPVYATAPRRLDAEAIRWLQRADLVVLAAPSAAAALVAAVGPGAAVVAIGPTTATAVESLGCSVLEVASTPSTAALIEAVRSATEALEGGAPPPAQGPELTSQ